MSYHGSIQLQILFLYDTRFITIFSGVTHYTPLALHCPISTSHSSISEVIGWMVAILWAGKGDPFHPPPPPQTMFHKNLPNCLSKNLTFPLPALFLKTLPSMIAFAIQLSRVTLDLSLPPFGSFLPHFPSLLSSCHLQCLPADLVRAWLHLERWLGKEKTMCPVFFLPTWLSSSTSFNCLSSCCTR